MTFYITPHTPRFARRWAVRQMEGQPEYNFRLPVDVREEDDAFVVLAIVPGMKAEDLNIQVLENVLQIEGEYHAAEGEHLLRELPQGIFRRTLRLPTDIEAEAVSAELSEGILTLRLPKAESARPKTIKVAVK
jgi:HSP20 family protein